MSTTHRLVITEVEHVEEHDGPYGAVPNFVRVEFGCTCRTYSGDVTSAETEVEARANAKAHHARHTELATGRRPVIETGLR